MQSSPAKDIMSTILSCQTPKKRNMVRDNLWTLTTEVDYERRVRLPLNIFLSAKIAHGWDGFLTKMELNGS